MRPPQISSSNRSKKQRRDRSTRKRGRSTRVRAKVEEDESSSRFGCIFLLLVLLCGLGYYVYKNKDKWNLEQLFTPPKVEEKHVPDPVTYEDLKTHLATERSLLERQFVNASTAAEQEIVLNRASALLEHVMPKMMRCWLGHEWDFNGTATVPGEGKIACGFYVSVIMRDAGFKVERIKLAQQPSQRILKTFLPNRRDLWITGGMPYNEYVEKIKPVYEGINIVGLDNHVGFIFIHEGEMRFIHSGGLQRLVVDEEEPDAYSLKVSSYRVIGNLTRNHDLLRKWLLGEPFPTAR